MRLFGRDDIRAVQPAELATLLAEGARLIDVRTHEEWNAGHLDAAEHIPLHDLETRYRELAPAQLTIFICRSGSRSHAAAQGLKPAGFTVANLIGGMKACAREGLSIQASNGEPGAVI